MPGVRFEEETKVKILVVETRDSAGRTQEQAESMDNGVADEPRGNAVVQHKPRGVHAAWANSRAITNATYPKALFHRAIRYPRGADGKPDRTKEPQYLGDVVNPDYPLILLAAKNTGAKGDWVENGSETNLIARHPYKSRIVPEGWQPTDPTIDVEACQREEAQLLKQGWVDSISKLDLPKALTTEELSD